MRVDETEMKVNYVVVVVVVLESSDDGSDRKEINFS